MNQTFQVVFGLFDFANFQPSQVAFQGREVLRVLEYPLKVQECILSNIIQYNAND